MCIDNRGGGTIISGVYGNLIITSPTLDRPHSAAPRIRMHVYHGTHTAHAYYYSNARINCACVKLMVLQYASQKRFSATFLDILNFDNNNVIIKLYDTIVAPNSGTCALTGYNHIIIITL